MTKKTLIAIGGPTASGKSRLAIALAKQLETEIVSADSRQIFRGLDIGTAKPSHEELESVNHHFINHCDVERAYTAADFEREATDKITHILSENQFVIMVGGTGLYHKAVIEGLDDIPKADPSIIAALENQWREQGLEALQQKLEVEDPEYASTVDMKNPRRLIRALSVHAETGMPFSSFLRKKPKDLPFQVKSYALSMEREQLYSAINGRVDDMIKEGLVEEARSFVHARHLPALQTVGYQELFPHFDHDYDLAEAIRLIKRNSRRYAKRQMTWFRNQGQWSGINSSDLVHQMDFILEHLQTT